MARTIRMNGVSSSSELTIKRAIIPIVLPIGQRRQLSRPATSLKCSIQLTSRNWSFGRRAHAGPFIAAGPRRWMRVK